MRKAVARFNVRIGSALAVVMLATWLPQGAASAADAVRIGYTKNAGDAALYIADTKGYFKAENIDIALVYFDSGARMVAPLGTSELDVGTLPGSAGLFNAASRQINNRIVADRSRSAPGYLYQTLMIRKDLIDSGRFKGYPDLKGLKMAVAAPGISILSVVNEAMKKGGRAYADVEIVFGGFPQQVAGFRNKTIDAAIMIEPFATGIVASGDAVRFISTEDFYPGDQFTFLVYGERFATARTDVAKRFMRAYVRGIRDFNDAIDNGRWATNAKGDEVLAIIAKYLELKPEQIRASYPHACDPNGDVNLDSMRKDLAFFRQIGEVTSKDIKVEDIVDLSFVQQAVRELGPYKPAK